jgi:putative ABC transport system ATP-binding protein
LGLYDGIAGPGDAKGGAVGKKHTQGGTYMALLEVKHLKKIYTTRYGGSKVQALANVTFTVEEGEFVAIMGESGSGKTTLLNILASLDKPTSGEVLLRGTPMSTIRDRQLAAFRRDHLGFIFRDFNLLDTFSVEDNIYLPLVLSGRGYNEMRARLVPLAEKLSITDILKKFPYEISGGQKQRVAAARALITKPDIVLADEPTGALDSKASGALLRLLAEVNREGQAILMVTHSARAASRAGRILFIRDGQVFHQIYRGGASDEEMYQSIGHALTVSAAGGRQAV